MFRYSYDEMEGDTVIFEREIIHPNISKWLKVITFIGENRKAIAIAAVLFLILVAALVVSLVVTSASDAGLNVDSQREIATVVQRTTPKEITELPLQPRGEESISENTHISVSGESTDSHHTAVIETDKLPDPSDLGKEVSSIEPEVSCQLKRRPLPNNWSEKSPISVLHEVEQDPPEFKFERCDAVFGASVKIKCESQTFGPAYSRKKSGGKGSAKELAAKLAVEALYNITYPPGSDAPKIMAATNCKSID